MWAFKSDEKYKFEQKATLGSSDLKLYIVSNK